MSQTFELVCLECKERQWVGQSNYIYTTRPEIEETAKFCHTHYGHMLKFLETQDVANVLD